jgi:5-methylcytosine-specific restriction endonuclease McrA
LADGRVLLQAIGTRAEIELCCVGCGSIYTARKDRKRPVCAGCQAFWDLSRNRWAQRTLMYVECKNELCDNLMAQRYRGDTLRIDNVYCSPYCRKLQGKRDHYRRTVASRTQGSQPKRRKRERVDNLAIAFKHGYRCHLCRRLIDVSLPHTHKRALQIDHLIPVSAGGTDAPENMAPSHAICNQKRSAYGPAQLQVDHG